MCEREGERERMCEREGEREREHRPQAYLCVRDKKIKRGPLCLCETEREREREREQCVSL